VVYSVARSVYAEIGPGKKTLQVVDPMAVLAAGGLVAAQNEAGGIRFCYEFSAFVGDFALNVADGTTALDYAALGAELRLADGPQKIYFEFHGGERFAGRESGSESDTHRGVGNVAENAAVHCTHWIKVPGASLKNDYDLALAGFGDFKSN
jgi:hypothetical protein